MQYVYQNIFSLKNAGPASIYVSFQDKKSQPCHVKLRGGY